MRHFIEVIGKQIETVGQAHSNVDLGHRSVYIFHYEIRTGSFNGERYLNIWDTKKLLEFRYKIYEDEFDYLYQLIADKRRLAADEFLARVENGLLLESAKPSNTEDSDLADEPVEG